MKSFEDTIYKWLLLFFENYMRAQNNLNPGGFKKQILFEKKIRKTHRRSLY
jgi:hypothetical protein